MILFLSHESTRGSLIIMFGLFSIFCVLGRPKGFGIGETIWCKEVDNHLQIFKRKDWKAVQRKV
jgi:hypothetical protein